MSSPLSKNDSNKILIIEDQDFDRELLCQRLSDYGFLNLTTAVTGQEGLAKVKEEAFDVVIVDTGLPDINGFRICEQIKEYNREIRVVLLIANVRTVNFPRARAVGADEYTYKTPRCEEIIWSVRRCLASLKAVG